MSNKNNDFIKAPVFGISEDELSTGSVNDNEVGTINGKKIKAHSITSDQIAAGAIGAVQLQAGAITAFKITVPNRVKGTTVVFSVGGANNDTLQWTSGVAYLMKMKYAPGDTMGDLQVVQVQQTISAGSYTFQPYDNAYYFYVEWAKDQNSDEPADSATLIMKKSTAYPDSDTAIVLAYAWYDPVLGLAQFQALDTAGGGVRISGNSIIAGSITAQNIKAGTITADRLSFQAFDKSKDTLDDLQDGTQYAKVLKTDIQAGHIFIYSETQFAPGYDPSTKIPTGGAAQDINNSGGLDAIKDGATYKKATATQLQGGDLAYSYIDPSGSWKTVFQSKATSNPPSNQSGLYMTTQFMGYWDGVGWGVYIRNDGYMFLGSKNAGQYLEWDSSHSILTVKGNIQANSVVANISITSPYITLSGSGYIAGGKSSFTDTNNGFWLGYYNGNYTFSIGNSSQYLKWDGTTLTVIGNVQANSVVANISITSPNITLSSSGYIAGGKSSFSDNTNSGFWIGYNNNNYVFIIGSSSQYLKWDGSTLTVRGDVQANSVISGIGITSPAITLNNAGYISGGKTSFTDNTNNGFWIGYNSGNYVFIIGNSTQYLKWDGTTLTVRGDIQATSIVSGISITSPTITGATINGSAIKGGTALFGVEGSSNYLKWDGTTLTVRGDIQASSVVANIGITSPQITLSSSGYIAGGKNAFTDDTDNGFWIGYYNNNYVLAIGNSNQYLKWNGTTLTVRGDVQASSVVSGISIASPNIMGGTITTSSTGSGQRVQLSSNALSAIDFYDSGNNRIASIVGDAYLTINSYGYGITLTPNYSGGYGVLVQGILKVSHPSGLTYTKLYLGDSDYIYTDGSHIYWNHNGTNHQLD